GLIAERRALRLRGFVFFKWKDSTPGPLLTGDPWPLHTGLLTSDGSPKPGFWAFARDVRELAHGPAPAAPGSAGLAIVSRRNVRLSPRGFAAVALGCRSQAVDACQGLLGLHTASPLRCGSGRRPAGFEIGATPFRIAVAPALVPVRLTAQGRRLADCAGRIRVRATVAAQPGARATAAR